MKLLIVPIMLPGSIFSPPYSLYLIGHDGCGGVCWVNEGFYSIILVC